MTRPVRPPIDDDDLPAYFDEPAQEDESAAQLALATLAAVGTLLHALPEPPAAPPGMELRPLEPARIRATSGVFFRCLDLPGRDLDRVVDRWWRSTSDGGRRRVERRLRLEPPTQRRGYSSMNGRLRRLTRWHGVPIVIELWPHTQFATCVVLRPEKHVMTSRRYFRLGHRLLDRLGTELVSAAAALPDEPGRQPAMTFS